MACGIYRHHLGVDAFGREGTGQKRAFLQIGAVCRSQYLGCGTRTIACHEGRYPASAEIRSHIFGVCLQGLIFGLAGKTRHLDYVALGAGDAAQSVGRRGECRGAERGASFAVLRRIALVVVCGKVAELPRVGIARAAGLHGGIETQLGACGHGDLYAAILHRGGRLSECLAHFESRVETRLRRERVVEVYRCPYLQSRMGYDGLAQTVVCGSIGRGVGQRLVDGVVGQGHDGAVGLRRVGFVYGESLVFGIIHHERLAE